MFELRVLGLYREEKSCKHVRAKGAVVLGLVVVPAVGPKAANQLKRKGARQ